MQDKNSNKNPTKILRGNEAFLAVLLFVREEGCGFFHCNRTHFSLGVTK